MQHLPVERVFGDVDIDLDVFKQEIERFHDKASFYGKEDKQDDWAREGIAFLTKVGINNLFAVLVKEQYKKETIRDLCKICLQQAFHLPSGKVLFKDARMIQYAQQGLFSEDVDLQDLALELLSHPENADILCSEKTWFERVVQLCIESFDHASRVDKIFFKTPLRDVFAAKLLTRECLDLIDSFVLAEKTLSRSTRILQKFVLLLSAAQGNGEAFDRARIMESFFDSLPTLDELAISSMLGLLKEHAGLLKQPKYVEDLSLFTRLDALLSHNSSPSIHYQAALLLKAFLNALERDPKQYYSELVLFTERWIKSDPTKDNVLIFSFDLDAVMPVGLFSKHLFDFILKAFTEEFHVSLALSLLDERLSHIHEKSELGEIAESVYNLPGIIKAEMQSSDDFSKKIAYSLVIRILEFSRGLVLFSQSYGFFEMVSNPEQEWTKEGKLYQYDVIVSIVNHPEFNVLVSPAMQNILMNRKKIGPFGVQRAPGVATGV